MRKACSPVRYFLLPLAAYITALLVQCNRFFCIAQNAQLQTSRPSGQSVEVAWFLAALGWSQTGHTPERTNSTINVSHLGHVPNIVRPRHDQTDRESGRASTVEAGSGRAS
jgi:hypothetical protein